MTMMMFMDKNPAVTIVLVLSAVAVALTGYATVRYLCNTVLRFRGINPARRERAIRTESLARRVDRPIAAASTVTAVKSKKPETSVEFRTAMQDLGYSKVEYEPVLAKMDPAMPLAGMIKMTIKALARPVQQIS